MITRNDRKRGVCNGDVGTLQIVKVDELYSHYYVTLPDGRKPEWHTNAQLADFTLAYALTVHKSQGSQYDTILLPLCMSMHRMLSRNLFYTAISRAKERVILYGDPQAVDIAMQTSLPKRKSMLVSKTQMLTLKCA